MDKESLEAAEFTFAGTTVKVARGRKGKWTVTEPAKSRASDEELEDMKLRRARLKDWLFHAITHAPPVI